MHHPKGGYSDWGDYSDFGGYGGKGCMKGNKGGVMGSLGTFGGKARRVLVLPRSSGFVAHRYHVRSRECSAAMLIKSSRTPRIVAPELYKINQRWAIGFGSSHLPTGAHIRCMCKGLSRSLWALAFGCVGWGLLASVLSLSCMARRDCQSHIVLAMCVWREHGLVQ